MNMFCPDGYVPTQAAIIGAAGYWFRERFVALEAIAPQSETKRDNSLDAAVRAFSQPHVPDAWRRAFEEIATQTTQRLRNFLHQGTLKAYYFTDDGCHHLSREFWATAQADGVLESGIYWPFGAPTHRYEQRPNYPLFMKQLEMDALLSDHSAKKWPLPRSKLPELVTAMRTHNDKPNRKEQREAVRKLPEFERYHLSDAVFREAERQVPRRRSQAPKPEQQINPGDNRGDNRGAKFRAS